MCGINEERWQKRLLAEPTLTYKKAIDIAQALETAEKNVKAISNGKDMPPPRIHHVGYKERERSQIRKPIRICEDYKLTVNQTSRVESYSLSRIEDIFASLSGGKLFTKLDLAHAYNQIPLDEESKKLVVINTQKYNHLPFSITSAPALFQRTIEGILQMSQYISMTY